MASLQQEKQKPPNTKAYGSTNTNSRTQESTDDEGSSQYSSSHHKIPSKTDPPSNEYVLNVAFLSFVGFMALQAFFALLANSQSMMADSEAMSVDALTYLFNMCAERFKHRPLSPKELELPVAVRTHQREMHRLYLELIPPLISVVTLILVTIHAIQEAWETLYGLGRGEEEEDVSAGLMLFFSGLNLVLDAVNVACFARAHQAYGLQATAVAATTGTENHWKHQQQERESLSLLEQQQHQQQNAMGLTLLQEGHPSLEMAGSHTADNNSTPQDDYLESWFGDVNLNMCSAWTHICADTMRSTAVLIAAGIAFCFEQVPSDKADSWAAVAVSVTILLSLIPLLRGLFVTARQIVVESKRKPAYILEY